MDLCGEQGAPGDRDELVALAPGAGVYDEDARAAGIEDAGEVAVVAEGVVAGCLGEADDRVADGDVVEDVDLDACARGEVDRGAVEEVEVVADEDSDVADDADRAVIRGEVVDGVVAPVGRVEGDDAAAAGADAGVRRGEDGGGEERGDGGDAEQAGGDGGEFCGDAHAGSGEAGAGLDDAAEVRGGGGGAERFGGGVVQDDACAGHGLRAAGAEARRPGESDGDIGGVERGAADAVGPRRDERAALEARAVDGVDGEFSQVGVEGLGHMVGGPAHDAALLDGADPAGVAQRVDEDEAVGAGDGLSAGAGDEGIAVGEVEGDARDDGAFVEVGVDGERGLQDRDGEVGAGLGGPLGVAGDLGVGGDGRCGVSADDVRRAHDGGGAEGDEDEEHRHAAALAPAGCAASAVCRVGARGVHRAGLL